MSTPKMTLNSERARAMFSDLSGPTGNEIVGLKRAINQLEQRIKSLEYTLQRVVEKSISSRSDASAPPKYGGPTTVDPSRPLF